MIASAAASKSTRSGLFLLFRLDVGIVIDSLNTHSGGCKLFASSDQRSSLALQLVCRFSQRQIFFLADFV